MEVLKGAGCSVVLSEAVSSRTSDSTRPELQKTLGKLQAGDELLLVKLDRLSRTQVEVISRLHDLQTRDIQIRTFNGLVPTRSLEKMTPLVVKLLTRLAEARRKLTRERARWTLSLTAGAIP